MADQRESRHDEHAGAALVRRLRLGDRQAHGPLAVFPVFGDGEGGERGPRYITLRQALADGTAVITEVGEGGSVPELQVVNRSEMRVLVLDGEELRGARQNRVLNTSVLIAGHSTLVVPVSCTEQGRWSYQTREFAESEIVAERRVRYAMRETTGVALRAGAGHHADQMRVWHEVDDMHRRQHTQSATGAMRDAYVHKRRDLDALIAAFPLCPGQTGMLVLHGARVVGLDHISRAPQYAELHDKLLRSYAFEALVSAGEPGERAVAEAFLERVADLPGRRFKSPSLGWDVRFEGAGVLGSALVYRGTAVHAAFFDVGGAAGESGESADGAGPGRARPQPEWRIADARERARRRMGR